MIVFLDDGVEAIYPTGQTFASAVDVWESPDTRAFYGTIIVAQWVCGETIAPGCADCFEFGGATGRPAGVGERPRGRYMRTSDIRSNE